MRRTAMVSLAVMIVVSLASCTELKPPDRAPDISGTIMSVDQGSILVVDTEGTGSGHTQAAVSVTPTTLVFEQGPDGVEVVLEAELVSGSGADVWFTGPVAESFPVQATAEAMVIRP